MISSCAQTKSKKSKSRTYIVASAACLLLTLIPFYMVLSNTASTYVLLAVILTTGTLQIFLQVFFFLHLDHKPNKRWNIISSAFFMIIIVIVVGGSLWIMNDLNYFMCSCKP